MIEVILRFIPDLFIYFFFSALNYYGHSCGTLDGGSVSRQDYARSFVQRPQQNSLRSWTALETIGLPNRVGFWSSMTRMMTALSGHT